MRVSRDVVEKARRLVKSGKVRKDLETERRIHFIVKGETDVHYVTFDKEKREWSCDCQFFTLKEGECSHIIASKMLLKE